MEAFIENFQWIAIGVIMVVEFLIAQSKLKSNSTIELVINIVKFIFGLNKKDDEIELK